jgi:hypothetical protein
VTAGKTLYGECGGGEYLSTSSAAYTISGSAGTVTVVNSCSNIISTGTNTSNSCSITGVTAGDLIVLCGIADSGVSNSSLPMSDGTTSFTLTALQQSYNSGSPDSKYQDEQCGYLLSANPGNKTYTMTFADTVNNNYTSMFAVQLHSTVGTWHFDTSAGSSAAISANSSLNTGNFTTTGATEAVIWDTDLDFITATVSSPLIGSTTPNEFSFSPIGNNHQYYMFNTSFSGQAGTLTYSTPTYWQTTILALKAY